MRIIILIGDANTGKTETLNRLACILHDENWECIYAHGRSINIANMASSMCYSSHAKRLMKKDTLFVGICPDGDSKQILQKNFVFLNNKRPRIGFMAVRRTDELLRELYRLVELQNNLDAPLDMIQQEWKNTDERTSYNQAQARLLYGKIQNV